MSLCSIPLKSDSDPNSVCKNTLKNSSEIKYRVRVCLQNYFSDERARCYLLVSRRRRVRWLEQRIRELFSLREGFCLRSRGHWLPSAEWLAILNPDDPVEVIPIVNRTDTTQGNQAQNTSKLEEAADTKIPIDEKKSTVCSKPSTLDTPYCWQAEVAPVRNGINDSLSHQNSNLDNLKKQALALLDEKYCETNGECERSESKACEISNEVNDQAREYPAQKRRRVRRRKRNSKLPGSIDGTTEVYLERESLTDMSVRERVSMSVSESVQRNRSASPRAPRLVHATM